MNRETKDVLFWLEQDSGIREIALSCGSYSAFLQELKQRAREHKFSIIQMVGNCMSARGLDCYRTPSGLNWDNGAIDISVIDKFLRDWRKAVA